MKVAPFVIDSILLRGGASWSEQWAEQEGVALVLDVVAVIVDPPAATQVAGGAGSEFSDACFELLETSVHG